MVMKSGIKVKESWGSRLGFILATSGAAVGLGNIQRFPYLVSENGGALFVLIYLLCVVIIGIPLILVEFSIGKRTRANPVAALKQLSPNSRWHWVGGFSILVAFFIFSYYLVPASWALGYCAQMTMGRIPDFHSFIASWPQILAYMLLLAGLALFIVQKGLNKGIERFSKLFMPLLLIIMAILIIRSVSMPGSFAGLSYYLSPDFSELSPKIFIFALGQAFFSLCIGEAVLITFGSYAQSGEDMVSCACIIALFDTIVAIMAGFIIFPALFAFGEAPAQGIGVIFQVLPKIFLQMPAGNFVGAAFFMLLTLAALTTLIALLEMPVAFLVESHGFSRKIAAIMVAISGLIFSIPSALSQGAVPWLSELAIPSLGLYGFYQIIDFFWGSLGMVACGFLLCIFVGWFWGTKPAVATLQENSPGFNHSIAWVWSKIVKYLAPIIIITIMLSLFI